MTDKQHHHGYNNRTCKCVICKLSKSMYQRFYTLYANPLKIEFVNEFANKYYKKYLTLKPERFYIFIESQVSPEMFKFPEKA